MTTSIEHAVAYCPRCGQQNPHRGNIPFRCPECEFTLFFGPVAAVGGLIVDPSHRLLLVRRARDPGKGLWGLPGGFVDRGETIEEALTREVHEETGLNLISHRLLATFPNQYNYRGVVSPVIDLFYVCCVSNPEEIQLEQRELAGYVWTVPDDQHLGAMAFPSNRQAIEVWLAENPVS